jgi:hypothetical protein
VQVPEASVPEVSTQAVSTPAGEVPSVSVGIEVEVPSVPLDIPEGTGGLLGG